MCPKVLMVSAITVVFSAFKDLSGSRAMLRSTKLQTERMDEGMGIWLVGPFLLKEVVFCAKHVRLKTKSAMESPLTYHLISLCAAFPGRLCFLQL